LAVAARDLERHHHAIAGREGLHLVADLDDVGDALVPERNGPSDRRFSTREDKVEIATRDRDRSHERLLARGDSRRLALAKFDLSGRDKRQLSHHESPPPSSVGKRRFSSAHSSSGASTFVELPNTGPIRRS